MPGGNSFNIVMATGTAEKLLMLGVLTQTGANLGMPVRIFVTGTALKYFKKDGFKEKPVMPAGFEDYMKNLVAGLDKLRTDNWHKMLETAMETGDVKIFGCSLMSSALGWKKEDLDPMIDSIVGATDFMIQSGGGQTVIL
jgi:peroxiredoxin family protein